MNADHLHWAAPLLLLAVLATSQGTVRGETWAQTTAPTNNWTALACSADGTKVLAAANDGFGGDGLIYISTNSGASWAASGAPRQPWTSIACTADGRQLVGVTEDGLIYLSADSGENWEPADAPGAPWRSVASSADGRTLIAAEYNQQGGWTGLIYISTNSARPWSPAGEPEQWRAVACSANGSRMIAVARGTYIASVGPICISTNGGATWAAVALEDRPWKSVTSSADGSRLAAAAIGGVFRSSNYGLDWTLTSAPQSWQSKPWEWNCISSSADGDRLVAVAVQGYPDWTGIVCVSTNGGTDWTLSMAVSNHLSVCCSSADGKKLFVAVGGYISTGPVYALHVAPAPALALNSRAGRLELSWLTPSIPFVLQETASLTQPEWADVDAQPALNYTNLNQGVSLPEPSGPMFYRLVSR